MNKLSTRYVYELILVKSKPSDQKTNAFGRSDQKCFCKLNKKKILKSHLLSHRATLQIRRNAYGKPYCKGVAAKNIHYSVSYANGLMAMIIGPKNVGIDIEHVNYFTLNAPDVPNFNGTNNLKKWVSYEACCKAIGKGISNVILDSDIGKCLYLYNFYIAKNYYLSIAMESKKSIIIWNTQ